MSRSLPFLTYIRLATNITFFSFACVLRNLIRMHYILKGHGYTSQNDPKHPQPRGIQSSVILLTDQIQKVPLFWVSVSIFRFNKIPLNFLSIIITAAGVGDTQMRQSLSRGVVEHTWTSQETTKIHKSISASKTMAWTEVDKYKKELFLLFLSHILQGIHIHK